MNPEGTRVIAVSFAPQTKTELDGFQPKFVDNDSILISNGVAIDTCDVEVEGNVATISTNLTGPLTAVYPYKAAKMNDSNHNLIDTVLVSTVQDGTFASANICMASMTGENEESLSFENKTAVFCIKPPTNSSEYVEVKAEGFNIANDYPEGSTYTTCNTIHVAPITTDSVYVSILVPDGLKVSHLKFSDGTNEKAITTGARAAEEIAAGTLYTVTEAEWKSPEADIPGALKGKFSVSADKQVYFSKGNMYWDGSAFKFEANQYEFQSSWNENHVSLFFWSRDASVADAENYKDNSRAANDVFFTNATAETAKSDFTINGVTGKYRTLSKDEWIYLFNTRTVNGGTGEGKSYQRATINSNETSVYGMILYPDGYTSQTAATSYASTEWELLENAGCVFLPAGGCRDGSNFLFIGSSGPYWSSSALDVSSACGIGFTSEEVLPDSNGDRNAGCSVRLVTDVPAAPTSIVPEGFVDLGVKNDAGEPLYWAECNLGATNAWDYGKYFSWGDVKGQTPTDNTFSNAFSWANDVFEQTFDKVSQATACPNGILASAYDAATQADPNHNWRTPTDYEFVALAVNCVWNWCDGDTEKYKGTTVPGYIVYKAKNENDKGKAYIDNTWMRWDASQLQFVTDGASEATGYDPSDTHIFFPAAGHGNGTNLLHAGSNGYYWSSSLDTDNHSNAYNLDFSSDDVVPQDVDRRCHGFSVRPVSD